MNIFSSIINNSYAIMNTMQNYFLPRSISALTGFAETWSHSHKGHKSLSEDGTSHILTHEKTQRAGNPLANKPIFSFIWQEIAFLIPFYHPIIKHTHWPCKHTMGQSRHLLIHDSITDNWGIEGEVVKQDISNLLSCSRFNHRSQRSKLYHKIKQI